MSRDKNRPFDGGYCPFIRDFCREDCVMYLDFEDYPFSHWGDRCESRLAINSIANSLRIATNNFYYLFKEQIESAQKNKKESV